MSRMRSCCSAAENIRQVFRDSPERDFSDFLLSGGRIIAEKDRSFVSRPEKVMEHITMLQRRASLSARTARTHPRESPAHHGARGTIRRRSNISGDHEGNRVYDTIREIAFETGVLGRFIPEFGALRSLLCMRPYHLYTVDEHSLYGHPQFGAAQDDHGDGLYNLKGILQGMERRCAVLSILFHDIGKAIGRHHEEEGYKG